jgi:PLP dependent protein
MKLLFEIDKEAKKHNRIISILLQMDIAKEDTKFGLNTKELIEILDYYTAPNACLQNVTIVGLMGMATNTHDENIIRNEFIALRQQFESIQKTYLLGKTSFKEISMGMSSDYQIAVSEGSTMVRIGSLLFGER